MGNDRGEVDGRDKVTAAYLRVQRNGIWTNEEVEHLTPEERKELLGNRSSEELLRWIDLLCKVVVKMESY